VFSAIENIEKMNCETCGTSKVTKKKRVYKGPPKKVTFTDKKGKTRSFTVGKKGAKDEKVSDLVPR
jgi:hypothetical protein